MLNKGYIFNFFFFFFFFDGQERPPSFLVSYFIFHTVHTVFHNRSCHPQDLLWAHGLVVVCLLLPPLPRFEPTTQTIYPPVMGTCVPGLRMSIDPAVQWRFQSIQRVRRYHESNSFPLISSLKIALVRTQICSFCKVNEAMCPTPSHELASR